MGLAPAVTMVAEQYALYGLTRASGPVFLARLTGWFSSMLALLTVLLLVFLVMLFPDGRLPSRRWRPLNSPAAASRLELPAATSSRTSSSRWLSAQAQAPDRGPAHGTGSSAGPPPPGREQLAASAPDGGNQKGPRP